ncbi:uncharacterized protein LOC116962204 isoform X5 [Tyto alba]|uniref:uncharacterized protein LOC116962204 isoform X5 n=1 Tax=Tyto alba TaxID=56313 RepID=UPI001C6699BB|nr:uncharacterized protein LOC116962204 isoform X5 [Tyto alba]
MPWLLCLMLPEVLAPAGSCDNPGHACGWHMHPGSSPRGAHPLVHTSVGGQQSRAILNPPPLTQYLGPQLSPRRTPVLGALATGRRGATMRDVFGSGYRQSLVHLAWMCLFSSMPNGGAKVLEKTFEEWMRYRDECLRRMASEPYPAGLFCNRTFDMYACWPDGSPGTAVNVSCPFYLPWFEKVKHGLVSRRCGADGQWVTVNGSQPWRDYSQCEEEMESAAEEEGARRLMEAPLHQELHPRQPLCLLRAAGDLGDGEGRAAGEALGHGAGAGGRLGGSAEPRGGAGLPGGAGADAVLHPGQPLLVPGGSRLPLQAADRGRLLREELLQALPLPGLGDPRGVCGALDGRQVPEGERGINLLIFMRILKVILAKLRANQKGYADYKLRLAKATLTLIPLFGIHEVVFIFATDEQTTGILRYVKVFFTLFLNSFQGFLVAVLYCFANKEVKSEMKKKWQLWKLDHPALCCAQ